MVPILVLLILSAGFAIFSVIAGSLTGPKRFNRAKLEAYECGIEPSPQAFRGHKFPVKYYLTAMLFIVFDIEIIFLYPVGRRLRPPRHVRPGRDGDVHPHRLRRLRLCVASRRTGVGLIRMGLEEKLPEGILLTTVAKIAQHRAQELGVAGAVRPGLLRDRDDGGRQPALRHRAVRHGAVLRDAAAGRPDDRGRSGLAEDGAGPAPDLRPDARAQVGARDGCLREQRRHVQQLRDRAGRRPRRAGRHVPARLPAAAGDAARRDPQAARQDPHRTDQRQAGVDDDRLRRRTSSRSCATPASPRAFRSTSTRSSSRAPLPGEVA